MKAENRLNELIERHPELEGCRSSILAVVKVLKESLSAGGKILICGNGGSGADAEHWAGELLKRFCTARPLTAELPPELAAELEGAFPAIALTSFPSFQSAWANDRNPDFNFAQLVNALGRRGDVLIGLSTSGGAKNVNHAVATARALGLKTIGLTGAKGGALAAAADVAVKVPATETFNVQELHLPVYHCICLMLDE
jgi:D-sedoheptulose 7-phosphate isomerase